MLYEINKQIEDLFNSLEVDENGEILTPNDEVMAQLEALQQSKQDIMIWLAKKVLNNRAEQDALKLEEIRLKAKRERLAHAEERLVDILDRECAGNKTDLGIASCSYRKTTTLNILDDVACMSYLQDNNLTDCIRVAEPEIKKDEVKKLLSSGMLIDGAELEEHQRFNLK